MKCYEVSAEELKGIQRISLEMLIETDRICRKHGIDYSIDGGTFIGAVRHKGFVPWDDDVDVIFTREEYNKFRKACEADLDKKRFFLQDYKTDKNYRWGYAKLRRKNTVQIRTGQENIKQHPGIFMDIFVVDNVPDNKVARDIHYFLCFCVRKLQYAPMGANVEKNVFLRCWYKALSIIPVKFSFVLRDAIANAANKKETELVKYYTFPMTQCYPSKYGIRTEYFKNYTDYEFEGYKVRGIKDYDNYLKELYGDYMVLPPKEEQVSHVTYSSLELCDVDVKLRSDK